MIEPNLPETQTRGWVGLIFHRIIVAYIYVLAVIGLILIGARFFGKDPEKVFKTIFQAIGFSEDLSEYLIFIFCAPLFILALISSIGKRFGIPWFVSGSRGGDDDDDDDGDDGDDGDFDGYDSCDGWE